MSTTTFEKGATALGFTGSEEPTSYWDNYQQPGQKSGKGPIPPGRYTFRVPPAGDDFGPGRSSAGDFYYSMNPTVSRGDHAGKTINYVRLSARKFPNRDGSMAGDLIKATGLTDRPKTPQEWFDVGRKLVGREFDGIVDLEVYDKGTGQTLFRKAADIPKKADGSPRTVMVLRADGTVVENLSDPAQERKDEEAALNEGGRKVFANSKIVAIYPVGA